MKIGDKVYQYDNGGRIYESEIKNILLFPSNCIYVTEGVDFDDRAIDKSVFMSEAKAKKAFERKRNNER